MADSFLSGSEVWDTITALSRRTNRGAAAIAVPWVSHPDLLDVRDGDTVVVDCSTRAMKTGSTDPAILAGWVKAGATVVSVEHLHAKVYVFGSVAIVGSANGSRNSELNLEEAALRTSDRAVVRDARAFVTELAESGLPQSATALRRAKRDVWSAPRRTGPLAQQAVASSWTAPQAGDRIWFAQVTGDASPEAQRWIAKNEQRVTRRSGLRGVEWYWFESDRTLKFNPGDVISLWEGDIDDESSEAEVWHPARVISRTELPGRAGRHVYLLAYPPQTTVIDGATLLKSAAVHGVDPQDGTFSTRHRATRCRNLFADLWPDTCATT